MTVSFWESITATTWAATPYPWRPRLKELCIFICYILGSLLRAKKIPVILLIGATKELRFALSLLRIPYDMVDYSKNMLRLSAPAQTDSLRHFQEQHWLMPILLETKNYDLIVGDLVLNLLPEEDVGRFFELYGTKLAPGALCLFRTRLLSTLSQKAIEAMVIEQLAALKHEAMYQLFANLQTLRHFDSERSNTLLSNYINACTDTVKKGLARELKQKYLGGDLRYFIHSVSFLKRAIPGIMIKYSHRPKGYVDTYAFILYKP